MTKKDFKQVEIVEKYRSYENVIFFNQTIYQNKTRKTSGDGYYYTLKTVVPRVIYDFLEIKDDIIYLIDDGDNTILTTANEYNDDVNVYKRKLNKKSHNFSIPKQLFNENSDSEFISSFIFIPSESLVYLEFK